MPAFCLSLVLWAGCIQSDGREEHNRANSSRWIPRRRRRRSLPSANSLEVGAVREAGHPSSPRVTRRGGRRWCGSATNFQIGLATDDPRSEYLYLLGDRDCITIIEHGMELGCQRNHFPQKQRKGFDTVVILVAWSIWKERNNRVFKHRQRSWREVAKDAVDG
uniref:Uncharacterized protein n=1 Tax=Oryza nivara TaxID=4536 RepID=A0A0E0FFZ7_ORYNI